MSTGNGDAWETILTPDDAATLQESGLASLPMSDGTRRLHKRRLNRSSDEEEQHLPLSPESLASSADSFVSIPEHLISLATLEHLGYNTETARRIWEHWCKLPHGEPGSVWEDIYKDVPFIEVAQGHIDHLMDSCDPDDAQWTHCMDLYGVNSELQQAIMDPKFRQYRLTESCKFWVQDTFQLRYRGLQAVQETSRERDMASQREASRPEQSRSVGPSQRLISDSLRMLPWLSRETGLSQAATSAANAPGNMTLYKGTDQALLSSLFDAYGRVDFGCFISRRPSDFSARHSADIYFAVDREVAEYYAFYAKRRSVCSAAVIVQMTIPHSVIESLSEPDIQRVYWPSTQWKSIVFHCRRAKKLPADLRKFQRAKLVIGTICRKPTVVITNLGSANEITEGMVLKTRDGRNAVQYVFKGDDGDALLEGTSTVEVFPFTSREFAMWYEAV
jgi:hypothetical protein